MGNIDVPPKNHGSGQPSCEVEENSLPRGHGPLPCVSFRRRVSIFPRLFTSIFV